MKAEAAEAGLFFFFGGGGGGFVGIWAVGLSFRLFSWFLQGSLNSQEPCLGLKQFRVCS